MSTLTSSASTRHVAVGERGDAAHHDVVIALLLPGRARRLPPSVVGVDTMSVARHALEAAAALEVALDDLRPRRAPPSAGTARANGTTAIGMGSVTPCGDGEPELRERRATQQALSRRAGQVASFFMRSFIAGRMLAPNCARTEPDPAAAATAMPDTPRPRPIPATRHR